MSEQALQGMVDHIRQIPCRMRDDALTDRELLRAFVGRRDESAFAALMHRHGPMVRDVCRRLLGRDSELDDAVQAVFLAFAQRGRTIRKRQSLASWLFGVAYRVCQRARRDGARRRERETRAAKPVEFDVAKEAARFELCTALDAELMRLPEKYRGPLIHCYLQGQTRDRAAFELGLSVRTIDRRLEGGRALLRRRLERCGLTLSSALLAGALSQRTSEAALAHPMFQATTKAAFDIGAGSTDTCNGISAAALALSKTAAKFRPPPPLRVLVLLLLAATAMSGAARWVLGAADQAPANQIAATPPTTDLPAPQSEADGLTHVDLIGDALPPGAVARLGSVNWRIQGDLADCMVVTLDGKNLVTADRTNGIALWNLADGLVSARLPAPSVRRNYFPAHSIALSANALRAAIADRDSTVHLLELPSGNEIAAHTFDHPVLELAVSNDGKLVAARFKDGAIFVWDVGRATNKAASDRQPEGVWQVQAKRKQEGDWRQHAPFPVGELTFSPDGKLLAWVDQEKGRATHLYDTATHNEMYSFGNYQGNHRYIAFAPDGAMLASLNDLSAGEVWEIATRKAIMKLPNGFHSTSPVAAFSPDGKALAVPVPGSSVFVFELPSGKQRWASSPVNWLSIPRQDVLAFTTDSTTLLVNTFDGAIQRFDAATGARRLRKDELTGKFTELAFSADAKNCCTLGSDLFLRQWDTQTGRQIRSSQVAAPQGVFSRDGRQLAVTDRSGTHFYDTAIEGERWHSPETCAHGFSDDGKLLTLSTTSELVIRDSATGKELLRIPDAPRTATTAISPDNRRIYAMNDMRETGPGQIRIWEIGTGRELPSLPAGTYGGSIRLSADGKMIASQNGNGGRMEFRETLTGGLRVASDLPDQFASWTRLSFTPDGRFVVAPDIVNHGKLKFFDVGTGQCCSRLFSCSIGVSRWDFTLDGKYLATTGDPDIAYIWKYPTLPATKPNVGQSAVDPANLWADLVSSDAAKAYRAILAMTADPNRTLPYLADHFPPAATGDVKQITALLSRLDSNQYTLREQASRELERIGESARSALEEALKKDLSTEAAQRIRRILANFDHSPELIRSVRAVEVLEHIDSPEARRILQRLAAGAPRATLTEEAKASLERLTR